MISPTNFIARLVSLPIVFAICTAACADPPIGRDEGLPVVSWEEADSVVGRTALVVGRVVRVGHTRRVHFLNFDSRRRDVFSVVVFDDALNKFQPSLEALYENKIIRVRGQVSRYRDTPQIVVSSPAQISVLDKLPEFTPIEPQVASPVVGGQITVGTFNVLNLFDEIDDPYRSDESTPTKPREQLVKLAELIRSTNADVLALQEVESRGYLQRFVDVFLPEAGYRHVVLLEGNDTRGIDVAVVSRLPIGRVSSHRHLTFDDENGKRRRLSRDLLCVEVMPADRPSFEVWAVHLKSNSDGREVAEPIRISEVRQIRQIYDQAVSSNPSARILVCGDFNDTLESRTLQQMLASPRNALRTLVNADPKRVTYNRQPYQSMIDFILASPDMAKSFVPGSYQVFEGTVESGGSDHNPVIARFHLDSSSAEP